MFRGGFFPTVNIACQLIIWSYKDSVLNKKELVCLK